MTNSTDLPETEEVKRRLDAMSEISRNARVTLFTLNMICLFVIFSLSSLTLSEKLKPYLSAMNAAFEEFRDTEDFGVVLMQADLTGWDWARRVLGLSARKDAEALLRVILKDKAVQICSLPPTSSSIRAACNLKNAHDAFVEKLRSLEESAVQLKTPFFKETINVYFFLPISTLLIFIVYYYMLLDIAQFESRLASIRDKLDKDVLRAIVHPWMLSYALYGRIHIKALFILMAHFLPFTAMLDLTISYSSLYRGAGFDEYRVLDWFILFLLSWGWIFLYAGLQYQIKLISVDKSILRTFQTILRILSFLLVIFILYLAWPF